MRAFVAVPFVATPELKGLLEDLRRCGADLKVVRDDHVHLTLKFLDEIADTQAQPILGAMKSVERPTPFDVTVRDVGAFPNGHKMNVLWAGLEDSGGHLAGLHAAVERALAGLGFPPEGRAFAAHLTVARKRGEHNLAAARDVVDRYRGRVFQRQHVDRFHLYRSTLTRDGPLYEVVGTVDL